MKKVIIRWNLLLSLIIFTGTILLAGVLLFNEIKPARVTEARNLQDEVKKQQTEKQLQMEKELKSEKDLMQKHQMDTKKHNLEKAAVKPETPPKETQSTPPPEPAKKTIYLTFDDGPQIISPEILALLDQYQFKATFFMLDGNIKRYPDAVRRMVETGHGVGIHGVSHNRDIFYASASSVIGEMTQTRNTIKTITGIDTYLVRTPFGSKPYMTEEYLQAVVENGYFMWDWNIDSMDWYYKDSRLVSSTIAQIEEKSSADKPLVILLHEKKETLAHLQTLLEYLSEHDYVSKAIDSSMIPLQF